MTTQQIESHQPLNTPKFSIPYFNNLISETDNRMCCTGFDDQTIDTYTSCGFNFVIASSLCNYPLATSIEILTRLACSEDSLIRLGKSGEITLTWVPDSDGPTCATFLRLPEGSPSTHVQIVIYEKLAYIVFPCFLHSEADFIGWHWLREKIINGIVEGILG